MQGSLAYSTAKGAVITFTSIAGSGGSRARDSHQRSCAWSDIGREFAQHPYY